MPEDEGRRGKELEPLSVRGEVVRYVSIALCVIVCLTSSCTLFVGSFWELENCDRPLAVATAATTCSAMSEALFARSVAVQSIGRMTR